MRYPALVETKAKLRLLLLTFMKTERLHSTLAMDSSYFTSKDIIKEFLAEERAKKLTELEIKCNTSATNYTKDYNFRKRKLKIKNRIASRAAQNRLLRKTQEKQEQTRSTIVKKKKPGEPPDEKGDGNGNEVS